MRARGYCSSGSVFCMEEVEEVNVYFEEVVCPYTCIIVDFVKRM